MQNNMFYNQKPSSYNPVGEKTARNKSIFEFSCYSTVKMPVSPTQVLLTIQEKDAVVKVTLK